MHELVTENKLTVLIVEKKEAGSVLEKNISRLGHNVLIAECYSDAMQKAVEDHCDLIVMDIDLPDWDGVKIISRIKELVGEINIVTMTDNNNREREQSVRDQRILYYAVKPLEFSEIRSILNHILYKTKAFK